MARLRKQAWRGSVLRVSGFSRPPVDVTPSPGPLRLVKAPAADHPLPRVERAGGMSARLGSLRARSSAAADLRIRGEGGSLVR